MDTSAQPAVALNIDEIAYCTREAQKEGVFAGVTSGLLGGLLGSRAFRFSRNKTIASGVLTGVLSGYFFTQAFLSTRLKQASVQKQLLARRTTEPELQQFPDAVAAWTTGTGAGSGSPPKSRI